MVHWLIRSAMCALMPKVPGMPGLEETGIDAFLVKYKRESSRLMWSGLVLGAVVFTITPLFTIGIPLPSFWLSRKASDRHAFKVAGHRFYLLRQVVFLLKMVAGLCWGAHPAIRKMMNLPAYEPDPGSWRTT